jgi:hypothetical protein
MPRHFGLLRQKQDKQIQGFNPEAPMDDNRADWPAQCQFTPAPGTSDHRVDWPFPDARKFDDRPPTLWRISEIALVVSFAFIVMAIILFACSARAHDYAHPENQQWYESLHNGEKTPCCDGKDANHIADIDWDTQCEKNNFGEPICHYRVFLYGKWWNVPAMAVVDGPNRDGSALVWDAPTKKGDEVISTSIRCFMPGAGG